jgi:hypothetical protein
MPSTTSPSLSSARRRSIVRYYAASAGKLCPTRTYGTLSDASQEAPASPGRYRLPYEHHPRTDSCRPTDGLEQPAPRDCLLVGPGLIAFRLVLLLSHDDLRGRWQPVRLPKSSRVVRPGRPAFVERSI